MGCSPQSFNSGLMNPATTGRSANGRRNFRLPRWADWPLRAQIPAAGILCPSHFFPHDARRHAGLSGQLVQPDRRCAAVAAFPASERDHPDGAGDSGGIVPLDPAFLVPLSVSLRGADDAGGAASPTRIRRNPPSCIECGKCARACPARLIPFQDS